MAIKDVYAYTSDDGDIKRIRLTNDVAEAGSFGSGSGFTDRDYVKVSKGNSEFGMRPRILRGRRRDGNALRYCDQPFATQAAYEAALSAGSFTRGGETWTVASPKPEDV